jgi:hypothetical protein
MQFEQTRLSNRYAASEAVDAEIRDRSLRWSDLKTIAERESWEQLSERTVGVVRATYLHLPSRAKLWITRKEFEDADPSLLGRVLGDSR